MKIFKRLFLFLFSIVLLSFILLWWFVEKSINEIENSNRLETYIIHVKEAPSYSDDFYRTYEKVYPNSLSNGVLGYKYNQLLQKKESSCPCYYASFRLLEYPISKELNIYMKILFSRALERNLSQKQCLNSYLSQFDFLYNAIGIKQAACLYYQKDLEYLNEKELASLFVMLKNPVLYNPIRRSRNLERAVKRLNLNFK